MDYRYALNIKPSLSESGDRVEPVRVDAGTDLAKAEAKLASLDPHMRQRAWLTREPIVAHQPITPAAYWAPHLSLTKVYYLRHDGRWTETTSGPVADGGLPPGLILLGHYAKED